MSNSQNHSTNSTFVSIRYAPSSNVLPDANEHEEAQTLLIDIAALRSISRIVEALKNKIAACDKNRPGINRETDTTGNPSGSKDTRSNCSKDTNREEKR